MLDANVDNASTRTHFGSQMIMSSMMPPRTTTTKRKIKDPNEPKRYSTSFLFFSHDNRKRIGDENPTYVICAV